VVQAMGRPRHLRRADHVHVDAQGRRGHLERRRLGRPVRARPSSRGAPDNSISARARTFSSTEHRSRA
jgi:hypothetical protein